MYIQRMPRESTLEVVLKRADFGKRAVWVVRAQVDKRQTTSTSLKMVISFLLLLFSLPFFFQSFGSCALKYSKLGLSTRGIN